MSFVANKLLQNATHSDPRQPLTWRKKKKCKQRCYALCTGAKLTSHPMQLTNAVQHERGGREKIYFDAAAKTTHAFIYVSLEVGKTRLFPPPPRDDARKGVIRGVAGRANSKDAVNRSSCNQPRYSPKVLNNHARRFQTVTSVACVRRWPRVRARRWQDACVRPRGVKLCVPCDYFQYSRICEWPRGP